MLNVSAVMADSDAGNPGMIHGWSTQNGFQGT